jgi:putative tryptophan/tyrosine transport system substrate-binding protein
MDRRTFVCALTGVLLPVPLGVNAQRATTTPRVAFLGNGSTAFSGPLLDSFRAGLRDLGYVEGQSILIEARSPVPRTARSCSRSCSTRAAAWACS